MPAADIKAFAQRLQEFADNYEPTAERIISKHSNDIADLQAAQLARGINSLGKEINPQYRPFTIEQKKQKSGLAGEYRFVTYFDTGELYRKLKVVVAGGKFSITADTFKFDKAEERSGIKTFGLTTDSAVDFRDHIALPEMQHAFTEQVLR